MAGIFAVKYADNVSYGGPRPMYRSLYWSTSRLALDQVSVDIGVHRYFTDTDVYRLIYLSIHRFDSIYHPRTISVHHFIGVFLTEQFKGDSVPYHSIGRHIG